MSPTLAIGDDYFCRSASGPAVDGAVSALPAALLHMRYTPRPPRTFCP